MTHISLTGETPDTDRNLLEPCNFCDARAGEPCYNSYAGGFYCPSPNCDQLYEMRRDALNCMMHKEQQR